MFRILIFESSSPNIPSYRLSVQSYRDTYLSGPIAPQQCMPTNHLQNRKEVEFVHHKFIFQCIFARAEYKFVCLQRKAAFFRGHANNVTEKRFPIMTHLEEWFGDFRAKKAKISYSIIVPKENSTCYKVLLV